MKIVCCLNQFLPYHHAGTEVYVWALSKELQKAGHEVVIFVPGYNETVSSEYEYDGLRVIKYAEPTVTDREFLTTGRAPDGLEEYLSFIRSIAPAVVHFHEFNQSNGITLHHVEAVRKLNIRTVMTLHLPGYTCRTGRLMYMGTERCDGVIRPDRCAKCSLNDTMNNKAMAWALYAASLPFHLLGFNPVRLKNRLGTSLSFPFLIDELKDSLDRLVKSTDRLIVLTRWYKKILQLNEVPANKLTYIQQGLPYVPLQGLNKLSLSEDNGIIRLAFIGRITPVKGLHLLLEAMSRLSSLPLNLDIYGQVADEAYYKLCSELTKSNDNVKWKGVIGQSEIVPVLSSYHALCLPSTFSEMSPLVIQEAFAAGIPVIGSDVYGIAEQVQDGINGLLFSFNDVDSLLRVLSRIVEDKSLLPKLAAKVSPPTGFSEVSSATLEVYRSILEGSTVRTTAFE